MKKKKSLFLLVLLFFISEASAATLSMHPLKILMSAKNLKSKINITNNDVEKVSIQLRVMKWTQSEKGKDMYTPTKDIIFFPKIFALKKKETKIVRIGYKENFPNKTEKAYRLFIEEIPGKKAKKDKDLLLTLNFAIPVFIVPDRYNSEEIIDNLVISDSILKIEIKNNGNSHSMVNKIKVKGFKTDESEIFSLNERGWYHLSGKSHEYSLTIPKNDCHNSDIIHIEIETTGTTLIKKLNIQDEMCN